MTNNIKKRIIHPFVGENYAKQGLRGNKTMILGESSYDSRANEEAYDQANQTIHVAHDAIGWDEGKGYWNKSRFYTRIARMFGYEALNYKRRKEFWNSVIYYNFLQKVLTKPRQTVPHALWQEGVDAFIQTVNEHQPEIIICFSKGLWNHLPKNDEKNIQNTIGVDAREANITTSKGLSAKLIGFNHPTSYGFKWQPVQELLHQIIPPHSTEN